MQQNVQDVDLEQLLKRSRTKANRLFYFVLVLFSLIFIFYGATLVDRVRALTRSAPGGFAEAEKQAEMWKKNAACTAEPLHWVMIQNGDKVDAVVCASGDIFIRVLGRDNIQYFKWLPYDSVQVHK